MTTLAIIVAGVGISTALFCVAACLVAVHAQVARIADALEAIDPQ